MIKSALEKEHQKQFCHRQNGAKLFFMICKRAPNFFWEFAERLSTFFGNLQNGSQLFLGICRTALNFFQEFSKRLSTFFYNFHNGAQRKIVSLQEGAAPYCKKFTSLRRDSPYRSTPILLLPLLSGLWARLFSSNSSGAANLSSRPIDFTTNDILGEAVNGNKQPSLPKKKQENEKTK